MATDPLAAVQQYIDAFNRGDTVALRRLTEGWRIVAWAWAKGTRA